MPNKIGILGCGWLGKALAENLRAYHYQVAGTTTTSARLVELKQRDILAYLIQLTPTQIQGDFDTFVAHISTLVISIPPRLRSQSKADFLNSIDVLVQALATQPHLKSIIYVSSTSVFKDAEDLPTYSETYQFTSADFERSALLESESRLKQLPQLKVLRLGGLYGQDRHPITYLAGRTELKSPQAPVNLIHQDDAVQLLVELIKRGNEINQTVFHGVNPQHPSRITYYQLKARKQGLELPQFNDSSTNSGKYVTSDLTQDLLKYIRFNAL